MADLIPAMEKALIDFSSGKVTQPVRQVIPVDPPGGFYGMMPALTPEGLGQKIVTFYPPNAEKDLPTHMAIILLNDPQTGAPRAGCRGDCDELEDVDLARSVAEIRLSRERDWCMPTRLA